MESATIVCLRKLLVTGAPKEICIEPDVDLRFFSFAKSVSLYEKRGVEVFEEKTIP